ncbi:hypothetical protein M408DRAFT_156112 [Serendipita vermifera MAFF 305830]|uniref:Uncharacterized protein n=1 Tax=Serendipita vermifera MAFF 305830 TaxID=933852 RepID=A0A0C3BN49_SERVB|nr:hypothetical protein M408DRAFT_156112 [Serendipita vermifera MAFF 305830]
MRPKVLQCSQPNFLGLESLSHEPEYKTASTFGLPRRANLILPFSLSIIRDVALSPRRDISCYGRVKTSNHLQLDKLPVIPGHGFPSSQRRGGPVHRRTKYYGACIGQACQISCTSRRTCASGGYRLSVLEVTAINHTPKPGKSQIRRTLYASLFLRHSGSRGVSLGAATGDYRSFHPNYGPRKESTAHVQLCKCCHALLIGHSGLTYSRSF